jgi:putative addiction module component (TIGR02574 family)
MLAISSRTINKLSVAERILLAEKIWESIPEDSQDIDLSSAQKKEIDRRLDSLSRGTARFTSWADVREKLHARRRCR